MPMLWHFVEFKFYFNLISKVTWWPWGWCRWFSIALRLISWHTCTHIHTTTITLVCYSVSVVTAASTLDDWLNNTLIYEPCCSTLYNGGINSTLKHFDCKLIFADNRLSEWRTRTSYWRHFMQLQFMSHEYASSHTNTFFYISCWRISLKLLLSCIRAILRILITKCVSSNIW
jgi:hypothetical protein